MTYIAIPKQTKGSKKEVITADNDTQQLLSEILAELKKLNLQLAIITDNFID